MNKTKEKQLAEFMYSYSKPSSDCYDLNFVNILNKICPQIHPKKPKGFYSLNICLQSAMEYHNRKEWAKKCPNMEIAARRHGWLEKCVEHMDKLWTKKQVINIDTQKIYESCAAAARSLGRPVAAVSQSIRRGNKCAGYRWAYYE